MSLTPTDRRYTKTHEWFLVDKGVVTVGITQFAADELTDITFVELPAVGSTISAGSTFGEIESVKATGELFSAVGGEVLEVNTALTDAPELVNQDPFGKGWMLKLRADDLSPLENLMDARAYEAMIGRRAG